VRLLLDTHIFLWFLDADERLQRSCRDAITQPDNQVFLSAVSVWEATVKNQLGKLPLPNAPDPYLSEARVRHRISSLSLTEECVRHLVEIPALHRDPFDRMLVCQAIEHSLTLVTDDPIIRRYPVSVFPNP
jgi:PIN domain nuclease of toxin-antitoxin system